MRVRYSEWNQALENYIQSLEDLRKLFYQLLLRTDGDVNEAIQWLKRLQERGMIPEGWDLESFLEQMERDNLIQNENGQMRLTKRGERSIRKESLEIIFGGLKSGPAGDHRAPEIGQGGERLSETRPYRFGDNISDLDHPGTVKNALRRGIDNIQISEDDFEVFETEHMTSAATVLLLDVSHSMVLYGEDRMTPAKTVAMALTELILTKFPKDSLNVVLFGDDAEEVALADLPYVGAGPYHTNTKAGLRMAQQILRRKKHPHKQIFMVTDGKPSCMWVEGQLYKNSFGLDEKIVNRTLDEATLCRRRNITITTFMVAQDPWLVNFVEDLTEINKGRAYFTGLDDLGGFLLHDFVKNRKRRMR
ncbi:MAG: VWA domain-containing protein [Candidatus Eisenbacteria bacterium]|uniref:VWA domain-containing protein n=1 Tax=Eiseniibacteriota bacterium TaxID=2212470 RepID=A0A7Y2H160_UNCEI|nr:VWA domain-containing protein [Candidatus Eisenbacteria bacterium]